MWTISNLLKRVLFFFLKPNQFNNDMCLYRICLYHCVASQGYKITKEHAMIHRQMPIFVSSRWRNENTLDKLF